MPEISRFLGLVIAIYYRDHDPPHFPVSYGEKKARFTINGLELMDGCLSPRIRGLIVEWASQHQDELRRDWDLARAQQPLQSIAPLE